MAAPTAAATLRIPDYELLRLVGRGGYGEVWMARNALGSLRAVKVVWRRNFEDDRPYEREFHGIRKFEPVSRKHEGLIDIYHVGRNNEDGYFYYVMELADDSTALQGANGEYRPLTLREDMRARGRMSVARSLEIGSKLASALDHLHRAGLVHRDIKPSNIIFIGGVPKLADIGLVAGIADARSYVGTEGFVPPEGPGSPSADIFSLGKVLYEISTGLDRNEFPKLPTVGGESGIDPQEFAEFNEILLKACEPSPKLRYQTAGELFGDLVFLQGGKSLRRVRGLERKTSFFSKVGIGAVLIATLVSAAYFGSIKQFQRAVRAEQEARAHIQLLEMQKAEELFLRDDSGTALAYLARIIRSNPTNRVATERLMSALTWRNFLLPYTEPLVPDDRPRVAVFSPDGLEVVSGSFSGTLQFWDAASGSLTWEFKAAEKDVYDLDWSSDRTRLAVSAHRGGLIYDYVNHQPVFFGLDHGNRVGSVEFSPDQRWVLTGSYDRTARIWDAWTEQPATRVFRPEGKVRRAVFSPDGRWVATATIEDDASKGDARIWDSATSEAMSPILRHEGRVNEVAFSPDGQLLATASNDRTVRLWRVPDGMPLGRLDHQAQVSDIVFSPDGSKVASASEDGTAILWDLATSQPIGPAMRHRAWVKDVAFSPDGLKVVTASEDNTTRFWDAATGWPISEPMRHPQAVASVEFSPQGDRLVTGVSSTTESSLWLWRTTGRGAKTLRFPASGNKRSARFIRQTGRLCVLSDRTLRMWPMRDPTQEPETLGVDVPADLFNLADVGNLAAVVAGNRAWIWSLASRQSIKGPLTNSTPILAAEFSPDASLLALASGGGQLTIWKTGPVPGVPPYLRCLPQPGAPEPVPDGGVFSIRFSRDGRRLAAACRDKRARIFDVDTGRLLLELEHDHWVLSAEFSEDGRRVVTASNDRTAQVWDVETGGRVGEPMRHDNDVLVARFSPDGRRVATASRDWTARVWDAEKGLPVSVALPHLGPVTVVSFSPDNVRVATGSMDETARIWDAETGQPLTDRFRFGGPVENVEFSADGSRLLIVPATGDIQLAEVLQPEVPAPPWLPNLAEAVARQRLNLGLMPEPVPGELLLRLKRDLSGRSDTDYNSAWARWFVRDPDRRRISPGSSVDLDTYVASLIRSGGIAALREALWMEPTNALAHALLARETISPDQSLTSRALSEADWHRRYARNLKPESREIADICNGVALRLRALKESGIPR